MPLIFTAAVITVSLYFSLQGVITGAYILLCLLGLNIMLVSYSAAVFSGLYKHIMKNSEEYLGTILNKETNKDAKLKFIVRLMLLLSVYHIYTIGYVFFAGMAAVTVSISLIGSMLNMFEESFLDK